MVGLASAAGRAACGTSGRRGPCELEADIELVLAAVASYGTPQGLWTKEGRGRTVVAAGGGWRAADGYWRWRWCWRQSAVAGIAATRDAKGGLAAGISFLVLGALRDGRGRGVGWNIPLRRSTQSATVNR